MTKSYDEEMVESVNTVAVQLKYLGNGDASTTMGAIEAYGLHMGDIISSGMSEQTEAIEAMSRAIEAQAAGTAQIAEAIHKLADVFGQIEMTMRGK